MSARAGLVEEWRDVDGLRWHAWRAGAGAGVADVVLVHGLGVSGRYLLPTAAALAPSVRVHVPDLPGFGRSGRPATVLDVGALAERLGGWLDACGIERPTLLGNSVGCQVIVHLAARRPARLRSAILVGPTMDASARSLPRQLWRLLRDAVREPPGLVRLQLADYARAGARRTLATARHALRDPIEDVVGAVRVPTLVVRGARDPIVGQRFAEELTRRLPAGRLVLVPGAAHAVNWTAAPRLAELVLAFMAEHDGSDGPGRGPHGP